VVVVVEGGGCGRDHAVQLGEHVHVEGLGHRAVLGGREGVHELGGVEHLDGQTAADLDLLRVLRVEGRVGVTGKDADRFNFKVPTLRNVEMTYPYFHDGAANTLSEAVDTMGRIQLGKKFTKDENAMIVAFLKTLTGDQPNFTLPVLPPSSDTTPRPTPFAKK